MSCHTGWSEQLAADPLQMTGEGGGQHTGVLSVPPCVAGELVCHNKWIFAVV